MREPAVPLGSEPRPEAEDFRLLLEGTSELVALLTLDGTILYSSPAVERLLGFEPEEMAGRSAFDVIHPEDRDEVSGVLSGLVAAGEGAESRVTYRLRHREGAYLWVETVGRMGRDAEGELRVHIVVREVSERIRAERELAEAKARYQELVEQVPAVVYTAETGPEGGWRFVSPQIESLLGYTPEEWCSAPRLWRDRIHPDDREHLLGFEQRLVEQGSPGLRDATEYRLLHRDGHPVWVRDDATLIPDAEREGALLWRGVLLDVSRRRAAEGRYRQLIELLPACVYEAERGPEGRWYYASPQIEQITGYSPVEWVADPTLWARLVHPDDREHAFAVEVGEVEDAEDRQAVQEPIEYRLIHRDGHVVWVRDEATLAEERGGHRLWRGVLSDVTAQHEAARQRELLGQVVSLASDAIVVADPALLITGWNFAAEKLYGYSAAEVIGEPLSLILPPAREDEIAQLLARMDRGERPRIKTERRHKDGSLVAVELTHVRILDRDGEPLGYAAIAPVSSADRNSDRRP